jgi:hypothetical protein
MIFLEDKAVSKITPLSQVNQCKVRKTELTKSKGSKSKRTKLAIVLGLNTPVEIDLL